jgi:hypothetical protein
MQESSRCETNAARVTNPMNRPIDPQPPQINEREICEDLGRLLGQAASYGDRSSRNLDNTVQLARLLRIDGSMPIGSSILSAYQVLTLLETATRDAARTRADLVAKRDGIAQERAEARATLDGLGKSEQSGILLVANEFTEFYWPYFLIMFLGLRIARFDYFDRARGRA